MIKDKRVKAIYHYLTESIDNDDIKGLAILLREYVVNGSFIDFEDEDREVQPIADSIYKLLG